MIQLPNNCNCTGTPGDPEKGTPDQLSVYPQNWDKANVSLKKDWYVHYYFRDPLHKDKYPKGKYIVAKNINHFKTREERQEAVRVVMATHITMLKVEGYNPITDSFNPPISDPVVLDMLSDHNNEIAPSTLFLNALWKALKIKKTDVSQEQYLNIKTALNYFSQAATKFKFEGMEVQHVERKHVRMSLEYCGVIRKETWTNKTFNRYRKDLSSLFKVLVAQDAIKTNPIRDIELLTVEDQLRQTLTTEERIRIDSELRSSNYRFWRLIHIFYHAGSRRAEMVRLQMKHINLDSQEFKILIKKRKKRHQWVLKPIKNIALPLWRQAIEEAKEMGAGPEDFLFSKDLLAGPSCVRPEQITRRWKRWVKDKMGIDADFYCLKHMNEDEIAEALGIETAAGQNNHSVGVARKHYAQGEAKRERDKIKKANNAFV